MQRNMSLPHSGEALAHVCLHPLEGRVLSSHLLASNARFGGVCYCLEAFRKNKVQILPGFIQAREGSHVSWADLPSDAEASER